jgi:hypothetical protein
MKAKAEERAKTIAEEKAVEEAEQAEQAALQEFVNFKCVIAGIQTVYFLKDKGKIEGQGTEAWITKDAAYLKMDLDGEEVLYQVPFEEAPMSYEAMETTYDASKTIETYDCQLNVVTEADVTPPSLPILTAEEFQAKLMEGMTGGMDLSPHP